MTSVTYDNCNLWQVELMTSVTYDKCNLWQVELMTSGAYDKWSLWQGELMTSGTYDKCNWAKVKFLILKLVEFTLFCRCIQSLKDD